MPDAKAAIAALDHLVELISDATRDAVDEGATAMQTEGQGFAPHLSGALAASITITGPYPSGVAGFTALVGPTVVYGRIREIGGPIPGRKTTMDHPYLRWMWNGRPVFKKKVHQHGTGYMLRADTLVRARFNDICVRHWTQAITQV